MGKAPRQVVTSSERTVTRPDWDLANQHATTTKPATCQCSMVRGAGAHSCQNHRRHYQKLPAMKMQMKCNACQLHAQATQKVQRKYVSHPAAAVHVVHSAVCASAPHGIAHHEDQQCLLLSPSATCRNTTPASSTNRYGTPAHAAGNYFATQTLLHNTSASCLLHWDECTKRLTTEPDQPHAVGN
jgi:hypothetical protein